MADDDDLEASGKGSDQEFSDKDAGSPTETCEDVEAEVADAEPTVIEFETESPDNPLFHNDAETEPPPVVGPALEQETPPVLVSTPRDQAPDALVPTLESSAPASFETGVETEEPPIPLSQATPEPPDVPELDAMPEPDDPPEIDTDPEPEDPPELEARAEPEDPPETETDPEPEDPPELEAEPESDDLPELGADPPFLEILELELEPEILVAIEFDAGFESLESIECEIEPEPVDVFECELERELVVLEHEVEPPPLLPQTEKQEPQELSSGLSPSSEATPEDSSLKQEITQAVIAPEFELFRGETVLDLVPFGTCDVGAFLDSPLPTVAHDDASAVAGPEFTFPELTTATCTHADLDPTVFRVRLRSAPPSQTVKVKLHVLVNEGTKEAPALVPIDLASKDGKHGPTASGAADKGMEIALSEVNPGEYVSPYLRVATSLDPTNSDGTRGIVHSLQATKSGNPVSQSLNTSAKLLHTRQYGRVLKVSADVDGPREAAWTLGGEPFARVKLRFQGVSGVPIPAKGGLFNQDKLQKFFRYKVHCLNQYWVGAGIEFEAEDWKDLGKFVHAWPRTVLSIADFSGATPVSSARFSFDLTVNVAPTGGSASPTVIGVSVPAGQSPAEVAATIRSAIIGHVLTGPLDGVKLDADLHHVSRPRHLLSAPAEFFSDGSKTAGNFADLEPLGSVGPSDVVLRAASGSAPIDRVEIVAVVLTSGVGPYDIYAPEAVAFADPNWAAPGAITRHWIRSFSAAAEHLVSVVIYDPELRSLNGSVPDCPWQLVDGGRSLIGDSAAAKLVMETAFGKSVPQGNTPAFSPVNGGIWTDPAARFVMMINAGDFYEINTLEHEMGHNLSDCNHVIREPTWFYGSELMHPSGPKGKSHIKLSRHPVWVQSLQVHGGTTPRWINLRLEHGFGGAARARIARDMPEWCVDRGDPSQGGRWS